MSIVPRAATEAAPAEMRARRHGKWPRRRGSVSLCQDETSPLELRRPISSPSPLSSCRKTPMPKIGAPFASRERPQRFALKRARIAHGRARDMRHSSSARLLSPLELSAQARVLVRQRQNSASQQDETCSDGGWQRLLEFRPRAHNL